MHPSDRDLIALRDGEPVVADTVAHVDGCTHCRERLAQFGALHIALQALEAEAPPDGAWQAIVARRQAASRPRRLSAVAAAAVVVLAAGLLWLQPAMRSEIQHGQPVAVSAQQPAIAELQARSRELEYLLDTMRSTRVMSLRTAGTVSALEEGIELIDYQLSAAGSELDAVAHRELWERRVAIMESLLAVRSAEYYGGI